MSFIKLPEGLRDITDIQLFLSFIGYSYHKKQHKVAEMPTDDDFWIDNIYAYYASTKDEVIMQKMNKVLSWMLEDAELLWFSLYYCLDIAYKEQNLGLSFFDKESYEVKFNQNVKGFKFALERNTKWQLSDTKTGLWNNLLHMVELVNEKSGVKLIAD